MNIFELAIIAFLALLSLSAIRFYLAKRDLLRMGIIEKVTAIIVIFWMLLLWLGALFVLTVVFISNIFQ